MVSWCQQCEAHCRHLSTILLLCQYLDCITEYQGSKLPSFTISHTPCHIGLWTGLLILQGIFSEWEKYHQGVMVATMLPIAVMWSYQVQLKHTISYYFSLIGPTGPIRSRSCNVHNYVPFSFQIPGYGWNHFRVLFFRVLINETGFRTLKSRTLKRSIACNLLIKSALQSPDQWDRVQDSAEQNSEEVHNLQYIDEKSWHEQSSRLWRGP